MCCFFKNEETQILAWIITDCILNICYGFLLFFMLDDLIGYPGGIVGPIWSFTVIVADIVLIFALKKSNTKFMLFWIFNSFSYLIQTQEMDLMQGPSMNNFAKRQQGCYCFLLIEPQT